MSDFLQAPPAPRNRFRSDRTLRRTLERLLPSDVLAAATPALDKMGQRCVAEIPALADRAEANPPAHVAYDAWGRRVDRIEVDPAYTRLIAIGQESGLVALPYEAPFGAHSRVVQAGLLNLFDPVSALATCPLTMTDGAAWLLGKHDPALAAQYKPRLTARQNGWTSGQWMTEKTGGSDVSRTETVAYRGEDGGWRLRGTKYFTSATSADMALALARPEGEGPGSAALSLFLLELRKPDGSWNGIQVRRLKDKMGTKALPTAELELANTVAVPVGGMGRGVAKVASLLNVARLWAGLAGPAATGHLLGLARDYAVRREAFGGPLRARPAHTAWLAQIAAEYEAMLGLGFETAACLGAAEQGGNSNLARLFTPLAKLSCARGGIDACSQLIESFGGAGYMEDTGLPRIFRNVHVHAIWEGTTNVLAHDVLRALANPAMAAEWLEDIQRRLAGLTHHLLEGPVAEIRAALAVLRPLVLAPSEAQARRMAQGMARLTQAAILGEAAQWGLVAHEDGASLTALRLVLAAGLVARELPEDAAELDALAYGELAA